MARSTVCKVMAQGDVANTHGHLAENPLSIAGRR